MVIKLRHVWSTYMITTLKINRRKCVDLCRPLKRSNDSNACKSPAVFCDISIVLTTPRLVWTKPAWPRKGRKKKKKILGNVDKRRWTDKWSAIREKTHFLNLIHKLDYLNWEKVKESARKIIVGQFMKKETQMKMKCYGDKFSKFETHT